MLKWCNINFSDMSNKDLVKAGAIGVVGVTALYGIYKRLGKSKRKLNVPNYVKDKVYLCCFERPREGFIQLSPFALKLEMWLRVNKVDFEYILTSQPSSNGQFPYLEYNGEEIADSNIIIDELSSRLKLDLDKDLTLEQKGVCRALQHLCEFSLSQSYALYRYYYNLDEFIEVMKQTFPTLWTWFAMPWSKSAMRKQVMKRMKVTGYGRLTEKQAHEKGCKDIMAISNYLGAKQFVMGAKITLVDCWVFAHLAQVMYNPMKTNPQRDCVLSHAVNVRDYVNRVKDKVFPDWDRLLAAAADNKHLARAD